MTEPGGRPNMFAARFMRICPRAPSNPPVAIFSTRSAACSGGSGSPGIDELFGVISRWGGLPQSSRQALSFRRLPIPNKSCVSS
jgi:hypothetical protein